MTLSQRLAEYVRACFTGIWIESHEHEDALAEIARAVPRRELAAGHLGHRPGLVGRRPRGRRHGRRIRWRRFAR